LGFIAFYRVYRVYLSVYSKGWGFEFKVLDSGFKDLGFRVKNYSGIMVN